MVTITVWLRVTRRPENVLLAAILSTMTNLYRWATTNLLRSAERRGNECRKMNIAPGIESKVVPLSDCKKSDSVTGGPSVTPFLVARQVRYLPCDIVYHLFSCFRTVVTAFGPQPPTRQEHTVQALLIQMLSAPQTY